MTPEQRKCLVALATGATDVYLLSHERQACAAALAKIDAKDAELALLRTALQAIWPYLQEEECLNLDPGYRRAIALCRAQVEAMT
jgi:hypothetical protein